MPDPDEGRPETQIRIADRCTCEQFTESSSHYATYPPALVVPVLASMCPQKVCRTCGKPSTRIVAMSERYAEKRAAVGAFNRREAGQGSSGPRTQQLGSMTASEYETLGWSDCNCDAAVYGNPTFTKWRPGVVLDPFAGSGTTLAVATGHGLDAIGIDLDERNAELAYERIGGLFLTIETRGRAAS